jgi:CBS domain-containing protein
MVSIPRILIESTVQQAAAILIESRCPILAVVSSHGDLEGWSPSGYHAHRPGFTDDQPLAEVMTREVIAADPRMEYST